MWLRLQRLSRCSSASYGLLAELVYGYATVLGVLSLPAAKSCHPVLHGYVPTGELSEQRREHAGQRRLEHDATAWHFTHPSS